MSVGTPPGGSDTGCGGSCKHEHAAPPPKAVSINFACNSSSSSSSSQCIYIPLTSQEIRIRQRSGNDLHFAVHVKDKCKSCQITNLIIPSEEKPDIPEQDLHPRPLGHEVNILPLSHKAQLSIVLVSTLIFVLIGSILISPISNNIENKILQCQVLLPTIMAKL